MALSPTVLIADDDTVLTSMLSEYLSAEGYTVRLANNGVAAMQQIAVDPPDLVVLDIMMPEQNGIDTLKKIRASLQLPVIMLTARGDDLDRILGLELGADDYLAKPCNPRELLARIKAVLRRVHTKPETNQPLALDGVLLDPRAREVSLNNVSLSLTQTEFDLLHLLLLSAGEVLDKKTLSIEVLGKPLSQWDRSIDVHISNLRKKMGAIEAGSVERIRTVRGSGYLYVRPENQSTLPTAD